MCRIRDDVALRVHHRWAQLGARDSHYHSYHHHRVPRTSSGDKVSTVWKILASWDLTTMRLEILFRGCRLRDVGGYRANYMSDDLVKRTLRSTT